MLFSQATTVPSFIIVGSVQRVEVEGDGVFVNPCPGSQSQVEGISGIQTGNLPMWG